MTIAVVDDDPGVRKALGRLLRGSGFEVTSFASAEEFLAHGLDDHPNCLVLDIHLDGMTGLELREKLARDNVAIPVIFMTAHDDAETRQGLRDAPGVPCLHKPFDEALLFQAIETVRSASP
jgi:FixJ family two-component response regulator